ncbi:MAG: hypothetical protein KIT09_06410 [Bryobacteraceae bacterium]|nr:hypothetical protein [Bryobacteraceae bacterium]
MTNCLAVLAKKLEESAGLAAELVGVASLERAAAAVAREHDLASAEEIVSRLSAAGPEWDRFVDEVVVPETWFFRDREAFAYLEAHARRHWENRSVRALSACCSTGEEPYSIAMTLLDAGLNPEAFRVVGADLSGRALAAARRGEYGRNSFRSELGDRLERHFTPIESGWKVRPEAAARVSFRQANILDPRALQDEAPFDAVFCRNALIYMREEARARVVGNLRELLAGDGVLFAGHSEMGIFLREGFEPAAHPGAFACRKAGSERPAAKAPEKVKRAPRPRKRAVEAEAAPGPEAGDLAGEVAKARLLADQGEFEAAAALCERIVRAGRADAEAYYLLGLVSQASERAQNAFEFFERALYLNPRHYESLIHMSLLLEQKGERERSRVFRRRAAAVREGAGE